MPTAQGKSSAFNIGAATRTHLLLFTPHPLMGEFGLGGVNPVDGREKARHKHFGNLYLWCYFKVVFIYKSN